MINKGEQGKSLQSPTLETTHFNRGENKEQIASQWILKNGENDSQCKWLYLTNKEMRSDWLDWK